MIDSKKTHVRHKDNRRLTSLIAAAAIMLASPACMQAAETSREHPDLNPAKPQEAASTSKQAAAAERKTVSTSEQESTLPSDQKAASTAKPEALSKAKESTAPDTVPTSVAAAGSTVKAVAPAVEKTGTASSRKEGAFVRIGASDAIKTIEEMTKAIEDDPTDAGAYEQRGSAYIKLEQFDKAIADFTQAIKLDPTLATAFAGRGFCYFKLAKFQESLKDLNEAIRLNPNLAAAYTCRGNVYSKLEQFQKSIQDINKGLSLERSNKSSASLLSRCRTEYLMGNYRAALADANVSIRKDPRNPVAYDNRGLCEHQLRQFKAAIADYNKALSLSPHVAKYICHRAISYAEQGQHERAIPDYDEAIRLKPDFALAYFDRAISHYLMHHYQQATRDIQQAIKYDPHYALAFYELPLDPTKGAKDVRKITNPDEYFYRATTRILMIKNQTALADLKRYLEMTNWRGDLSLPAVILSYLGFMVNHQGPQAQQVLAAAAIRADSTQWPYPVIRYLKHEIKADELLAQAGDNLDRLTDAHAFIGVDMMLSGSNRKEAVKHMMWAKFNGNGNLLSYSLAVREIEKIQFKKHRETERT